MSRDESNSSINAWGLYALLMFVVALLCFGAKTQFAMWWDHKLTQWALEEKLASDHVVQITEEDRDQQPWEVDGKKSWPLRERFMLKSDVRKQGIAMLRESKTLSYPLAREPETVGELAYWEKQYRWQQEKQVESP